MKYLWPALLAGVGIVLGTIMTCIAPFVAVAVLAARTLSSRAALGVVFAMWLGNQAIGFGFEHYPHDSSTLAWGLAILTTTCALVPVAKRMPTTPFAFVVAFVAYEGLQYVYALAIHDAGNYTLAIDALVFEGNVLGIAILGAIRLVLSAGKRAPSAVRRA